MTTSFERPLQVVEDPYGQPQVFLWRGRRIRVRHVLEEWEEVGCWWLDEEPRRVFRVLDAGDTLYELHRFLVSGWRLARTYD
jgi:hypothetical protein